VAVFPTTAPITSSGRKLIQKAFGCGIFDLYQSADGGLSATECHEHQGLHLAEERCLVEVPNTQGEHDVSVIVTDLFNYAMLFICYENGDEITATRDLCNCGRESLVIKRVRGKTYAHISLPNGRLIHSEIFSYYLRNFLAVRQFCVRQITASKIILEISLDPNYSTELPMLDKALAKIPSSFPGLDIECSYVEKIIKHPNQKYVNFVPCNPEEKVE
jgi:phenylacetate-CoA ligase